MNIIYERPQSFMGKTTRRGSKRKSKNGKKNSFEMTLQISGDKGAYFQSRPSLLIQLLLRLIYRDVFTVVLNLLAEKSDGN